MNSDPFPVKRLSSLMLGTVQFGVPYGVANQTGQPAYSEVLAIVEAALERGCNAFDTAAIYGTSEEVLGRALHELSAASEAFVVTKIFPLTEPERSNPDACSRAVRNSVVSSLRKLRLEVLPMVLFHNESDIVGMEELWKLREEGKVGRVGMSCSNNPAGSKTFLKDPRVQALQIPCNLLDPRFLRAGTLTVADAGHVDIFVRSAFLQGLLLMPEASVPPFLQTVLPIRKRFQDLAERFGMDLPSLALRFVLSLKGVSAVIVGVERLEQFLENEAILREGPLPTPLLDEVLALLPDLPETITTPTLWESQKPSATSKSAETAPSQR